MIFADVHPMISSGDIIRDPNAVGWLKVEVMKKKFLKYVTSPSISYGVSFIWFQDRTGALYTVDQNNITYHTKFKAIRKNDCVTVSIPINQPEAMWWDSALALGKHCVLDKMIIFKNVGPKR